MSKVRAWAERERVRLSARGTKTVGYLPRKKFMETRVRPKSSNAETEIGGRKE